MLALVTGEQPYGEAVWGWVTGRGVCHWGELLFLVAGTASSCPGWEHGQRAAREL